MTLTFWLLLIPAVLTFGLLAWATVRVCEAVERAWRRYQVRREMAKVKPHTVGTYAPKPWPDGTVFGYRQTGPASSEMLITVERRKQLENAATSQDRYSRRIH